MFTDTIKSLVSGFSKQVVIKVGAFDVSIVPFNGRNGLFEIAVFDGSRTVTHLFADTDELGFVVGSDVETEATKLVNKIRGE